jgi:hypothetical protein
MISTEHSDTLRISYLQGQKERHDFNAVIAPINIITHEQIIDVWAFPSDSKHLQEIIILPVNISNNCARGWNANNIWLSGKKFLRLREENQERKSPTTNSTY